MKSFPVPRLRTMSCWLLWRDLLNITSCFCDLAKSRGRQRESLLGGLNSKILIVE